MLKVSVPGQGSRVLLLNLDIPSAMLNGWGVGKALVKKYMCWIGLLILGIKEVEAGQSLRPIW